MHGNKDTNPKLAVEINKQPQSIPQRLFGFLATIVVAVWSAINGWAQGLDLSHWDGGFLPATAKQAIHFAVMKLTEGTIYIDRLVDKIWAGVKDVAIRGGYHYQLSASSWKAQADHYISVASRYSLHFHVLDLEEIGNTYSDTMFADTRRIIDYWRSVTRQKVVLYTNISTYEQFAAAIKRLFVDGQIWLDELEIWIAWPSTSALKPLLPKGRETARLPWTFWQKAWDGTPEDWGTEAFADVNVFNGTPEQLAVWAGEPYTDPPTEPPTTGEIMNGKVLSETNIRANNNKGSEDLGDLKAGDLVTYSEVLPGTDGLLWCKMTSATRSGAPVKLTNGRIVAEYPCFAWKNNIEETTPTEPPVVTKPTVSIFIDAGDDYSVQSDGSGMIKLVPK